jgi:hypothetical protein
MLKPWPRYYKTFGGEMLPVIPPFTDSDTIKEHLRGKVPGIRKANGKWIGLTGSLADRFMTEQEAKQAHADGAGGGMQARDCPAVDGDVDDPGLSRELIAYFEEILGFAPIRRREGSSRFLMMYGADGAHIRKMRLAFHMAGTPEDTPDKPQAIELLGAGQYYNVFGVHPSGNPYYWDTDPCDLGPFGLTPLNLDAFKTALGAIPALFGLRVVGRTPHLVAASSGHRTSLADASKWAPSPQLVIELLKTYRPETLGHDEFVQHMAAIKAALGEAAEDCYAEVLDWAPGVRSTEDEATRKVWDSITDTTVGWNWLVDKSGDPGGVVAAADFDTPPDETKMPKAPEQVELDRVLENWVYDTMANVFYDKRDGRALKEKGFNAENTGLAKFGLQGKRTAAAIVINASGVATVRTRTYRPMKIEPGKAWDRIIDEEFYGIKCKAFNLWNPSPLKPVFDIRPDLYIDHLKRLIQEETAQRHFLDWLSYILQNPGKKIGHAPFLCSDNQGVGKDTLFAPLVYGIGLHNVRKITPEDLRSPHNTFLNSQLIICNEMANFEKNFVYNRLKPYLEMSNTHLTVNPKHSPTYDVPNLQNWAFCSNYMNAIPMDDTDRRIWAYLIETIPELKEYFHRLYHWLLKDGGNAITVGWLMQRDISNFNPADAPPMTEAKSRMIDATRPPAVRWVMKQFDAGKYFHQRKYAIVSEIREFAIDSWDGAHLQIYEHHVTAALRLLGFVAIPERVWLVDRPVTIWTNDKRPEILKSGGQLLAQRLIADQKK